MNISSIMEVGTQITSRVAFKANKMSPEVLVGVGIVGLVAAGVLAARSSMTLRETIEEFDGNVELTKYQKEVENIDDSMYRKALMADYRQGTWNLVKLYGPSVTLGALSIGCILGGHHILRQRNLAIAAAYKMLETSYSEYRKRVVSEIGEDKESKIYMGQKKEMVLDPVTNKKKGTFIQNKYGHSPYAKFFDEVNTAEYVKNRPDLNQFKILSVQRYMNQRLQSKGYVFLNEVYEALGFDRTGPGQVVGWLSEKYGGVDGYIDFNLDNPENDMARMFLAGDEAAVRLDFNVDGLIYERMP